MATIIKAYTFLDTITGDASEVNRNFDDLYATINTLNSENFAACVTLAASSITITDTASNFALGNIEDALGEPTHLRKGLNTIHAIPCGTGAIQVFPGKVEIGGKVYSVSTRLSASGLTMHDSGQACGSLYIVCGPPASGEEITASDLFLVEDSSITVSASYDIDAAGYYYGEKRLIGACFCFYSGCQLLVNSYNPDPVQKPFRSPIYGNSTDGTLAEGLFNITSSWYAGVETGTYIQSFNFFYDNAMGAYGYAADIRLNTACEGVTGLLGGVAVDVNYAMASTLNSRASLMMGNTNTQFKVATTFYVSITENKAITEEIHVTARPIPRAHGATV